jgi:hypothetical protein
MQFSDISQTPYGTPLHHGLAPLGVEVDEGQQAFLPVGDVAHVADGFDHFNKANDDAEGSPQHGHAHLVLVDDEANQGDIPVGFEDNVADEAAAAVGNEVVNVVSDDDLEGDDLEDDADGNNVSCVFASFLLFVIWQIVLFFVIAKCVCLFYCYMYKKVGVAAEDFNFYPDSFDASDESILHPSSEILECTPDSAVGKVDLSVDADISTIQANPHGVPDVNGGIYSCVVSAFLYHQFFPSLRSFLFSFNTRFLFCNKDME